MKTSEAKRPLYGNILPLSSRFDLESLWIRLLSKMYRTLSQQGFLQKFFGPERFRLLTPLRWRTRCQPPLKYFVVTQVVGPEILSSCSWDTVLRSQTTSLRFRETLTTHWR